MARANYNPDALFLLTNFQYNLTSLHVIDEADLDTKTCAVQINTKNELEGLY